MSDPSPSRCPRRLTDDPLPPYAFVPGKSPHPHTDPAGHKLQPPAPTLPDPDPWQECRAYLYGIDLFNHGYYWEAHESWEGLWHTADRHGLLADFLKGLIHLAAAGVKHLEGVPAGVVSHVSRAAQLWQEVARVRGESVFLGLDLAELLSLTGRVARDGWPEVAPVLIPTPPG
jgi:hypothetical protein